LRAGFESFIVVSPEITSHSTEVGVLSFISTTTIFGTPGDITLSELALEAFFPADPETAAIVRRLSE
jgi:hypothetical protein